MDQKELENRLYATRAGKQWHEIGVRHHHGICLPLFSLHSASSCGIGEYPDLIPLIHWCKEVGMDVIQLLPLNDTGLGDSPYSAISAFALNPIHLAITKLPLIERVANYQEKIAHLQSFNRSNKVQYKPVRELRYQLLQEWFHKAYEEISKTESYHKFVSENGWLKSYALYKSIKETQDWRDWEHWPPSLKSPSDNHFSELQNEFSHNMHFHQLIQYYCFEQFEKVKKEATEQGILLKGDLPILIGRDSADVWSQRHFFFMHLSAGAPPRHVY